ncbi:hypothetical protein HPP92_018462 [Vanilla planifolia]|uniref:Uncharacterized protein n=1 Tax=Vanilla planifolia TaxID=51239 RepID=A0A835UMA1_VANPL|nr:hypothetical protein HPP92_018462 [Vanilla planifolia]
MEGLNKSGEEVTAVAEIPLDDGEEAGQCWVQWTTVASSGLRGRSRARSERSPILPSMGGEFKGSPSGSKFGEAVTGGLEQVKGGLRPVMRMERIGRGREASMWKRPGHWRPCMMSRSMM